MDLEPCPTGHPRTEETAKWRERPGRSRERICRLCRREYMRGYMRDYARQGGNLRVMERAVQAGGRGASTPGGRIVLTLPAAPTSPKGPQPAPSAVVEVAPFVPVVAPECPICGAAGEVLEWRTCVYRGGWAKRVPVGYACPDGHEPGTPEGEEAAQLVD